MGWGLPGILRALPSPTVVPRDQLSETLSLLEPDARIVDVGAGGRRVTTDTLTVDYVKGPGVDIAADIHDLPLDEGFADCVICTGTLEHVADPWQAIRELHRITRPGGMIHVDVPFMQGYHADPTDYWRFTLDGLRLLCREFDELEAGVHIGPSSGVVWILREWANSLSSNRILSNLFLIPVALVTAPFKYFDYLLINRKRSHHVASAVFFRGRKPEAAEPDRLIQEPELLESVESA